MYTFGFNLFSLYTGELRFEQTKWDKTQILLGTSWGTHLGTCEHIENKWKKKTKNPSTSPRPSKRKKLDCSWVFAEPLHWLHEISASRTVGHHFLPRLMAGAEFWGHSLVFQRKPAMTHKIKISTGVWLFKMRNYQLNLSNKWWVSKNTQRLTFHFHVLYLRESLSLCCSD